MLICGPFWGASAAEPLEASSVDILLTFVSIYSAICVKMFKLLNLRRFDPLFLIVFCYCKINLFANYAANLLLA